MDDAQTEFLECISCSDKPGATTLCNSCINNRTVICRLKEQIKELIVINECQAAKIRDYLEVI